MSTKRKVYTFYIIAILVMVLVLMLFDLNIMAKAIVGLMIVFCIFVMRSIPNVDLYLRLLIEADEELAKDPTIDQMSPSYNIQLNNRIAERLESLDKGNNK